MNVIADVREIGYTRAVFDKLILHPDVSNSLRSSHETIARESFVDELSTFDAEVPTSESLVEKTFDARVELKVATSKVAMHLSTASRNRIFDEFDYILDAEIWDEADKLPDTESYKRFLTWIIFTGDVSWSSLGVDDDGSILVAWVRDNQTMTANFGQRVKWTKRVSSEGELQISLGDFSLTHFARQSAAFLADI